MKKLFSFILFCYFISVSAQNWSFEKPDYQSIDSTVNNTHSEFFFPKLISRYLDADTSLSLLQKRYLYYGFVSQPKYQPYFSSNYSKQISEILNNKSLSKKDYKKIIILADKVLKENFFDVDAYLYKLYAYKNLEEKEEFQKDLWRMQVIIDVIMSSGNGTSPETAFYVVSVAHEYAMLNYLDFAFPISQSLVGSCDYLELPQNPNNVKGLYFNIQPSLDALENTLK